MPELLILFNILEYMESEGLSSKLVRISIDEELKNAINSKHGTSFSIDDLQKAADKCKAHDWLQHTSIGSGKYSDLGITTKGVGAARSKKNSIELLNSRKPLKQASDYIEDHKGLFVVLGFFLALLTLLVRIAGEP
jgi:hypothetical protein